MAKRAHLKRPFHNFRRPAGYSLQEKVAEQWESTSDSITLFVLSAFAPGVIYALSGFFWFAAAVGTVLCLVVMRRLLNDWPAYQDNKFGLLGEQITGAELDALQTNDVRPYHDLVLTRDGHSWNIDHVLLTTKGVLVVETKAKRRKNVDGSFPNKLTYDGKRVTFPDGTYDTEAIRQVQRNAKDLRGKIGSWTGGDIVPVFLVLVYPGWKVERTASGGVYVVGHDKIGQLLPLRGETICPKIFAILKVNLDRETRVVIEDPAPQVKTSTHHSNTAVRSPKPSPAKEDRAALNA